MRKIAVTVVVVAIGLAFPLEALGWRQPARAERRAIVALADLPTKCVAIRVATARNPYTYGTAVSRATGTPGCPSGGGYLVANKTRHGWVATHAGRGVKEPCSAYEWAPAKVALDLGLCRPPLLTADGAMSAIRRAGEQEFGAYRAFFGKCKRWARTRVSCVTILHTSYEGCLQGEAHVALYGTNADSLNIRWRMQRCLG